MRRSMDGTVCRLGRGRDGPQKAMGGSQDGEIAGKLLFMYACTRLLSDWSGGMNHEGGAYQTLRPCIGGRGGQGFFLDSGEALIRERKLADTRSWLRNWNAHWLTRSKDAASMDDKTRQLNPTRSVRESAVSQLVRMEPTQVRHLMVLDATVEDRFDELRGNTPHGKRLAQHASSIHDAFSCTDRRVRKKSRGQSVFVESGAHLTEGPF